MNTKKAVDTCPLPERDLFEYALKGLRWEREENNHRYRRGLNYLKKHGISSSSTEDDIKIYQEKRKDLEELYLATQELENKIEDLQWFIDTELDKGGKYNV